MLCNKQYIGKSETTFDLRLNNYRKDINKQNLLQVGQHFRLTGRNFSKPAKFTLIEQLNDVDKKLVKYRPKKLGETN